MPNRDVEDALTSMLRTDYIALSDTEKLSRLADYYVDYFGYLGQVLGESDQLIVGRRGTGKTTLLYRALVDCMRSWDETQESRARPRTLGIYIDLEKCQSLSSTGNGSFEEFEHAFVSEVCDALAEELHRSWPALDDKPNLLSRLFKSAELEQTGQVKEHLRALADIITSGLPRLVNNSGRVETRVKAATSRKSSHGLHGVASPTEPKVTATLGGERVEEGEEETVSAKNVTYRLMFSDFLRVLGGLREAADIPCILLFVDEYSGLNAELQGRFSTLLKKILGNHNGVYVKLGAITDHYHLGSTIILQRDLFELPLDLDSYVERSGSLGTAMRQLEGLTHQIVEKRLLSYGAPSSVELFDDVDRVWPVLSRSAMGVPRTLGIVLRHAWYRAESAGRPRISMGDVDAGIAYASNAYLKQMIGASEGSTAIPSHVMEVWEALLARATKERAVRGSRGAAPASHFMVFNQNESHLRYLNMFFLVHLLTKGRTTKKSSEARSLYCFDYGMCDENKLGWGDDKNVIRQQRFAYDGTLEEFGTVAAHRDDPRYRCPACGKSFAENELRVGDSTLTFCPDDRTDLELITELHAEHDFTEEEIKIVGAIRSANPKDRLVARQVADDVGCYVQKVAKFGDKLAREEVISLQRDTEKERRIYFKPE